MAYAQWVTLEIDVKGFDVIIQNVNLSWGKFHQLNNKDSEIKKDKVEGKIITENSDNEGRIICACGRSDAASGTEGSFEIYLYDPATKKAVNKLSKVYWDCPWGSKKNQIDTSTENDGYLVGHSYANLDSGALGSIVIKIRKV